ncbi:DNA polymerase alpha, subunit B N-terminal [Phytophthora cactorum]|nr:DNA polymerase alpha, subunit B N-terminal [Phytophthora cactorum]
MNVDVATIRAAFEACNLDLEEDAASTCVSICTEFGLSSDDMAAQWDAYSMNQQLSGAANADGLVAFRSHLKQQQQQTKAQEAAPTAASQKRRHPKTPVVKRETESQDKLESLYSMKSPDGKHARSFTSPAGSNKVQRKEGMFSPSSMQSPPGSSYEKRTDAGKSVADFNGHLRKQIEGMGANTGKPVDVKAPFPSRNLAPNSSYMYTPLFQRAIALDEQLVEYEELVKEKFKLEELKPVGDPSPAQVTVVGRIVCEAAEGKLNPSVVQIEGSRKTCGGQRVLLDLSAVPNFQIFPGKIVALEGVFPDTRSPLAVKSTTCYIVPARIKEIQSEHGNPVRVLTACGPFTTTSNVDYLPLNDLLQIAIDQKPDVLVLVGPFIDSMHSMFQDGLVKYDGMMLSFEEIFLFKVMTLLNNVLSQDERIQIVIVPSLRDANHEYVYPQPPLNKKKACEAFEAADYAKFATNTDFSAYVNKLSISEASTQCSPTPNSEAPIDLRYMKQFQFEQTPDILLLPSILNRFCGTPSALTPASYARASPAAPSLISPSFLCPTTRSRAQPMTRRPFCARPNDRRDQASNTSLLTSKEFLIGHIKQNFDLETQCCRERDCNTAFDAEVDHNNAFTGAEAEEKEADIQTLQEQQQLRFPLLMHETMRSLRSLEDNQSDRTASPSLLSHSVISSMAHDRIDVDTRIHEYEQQIAELYEENQQEKLKNEMLSECLRDQKHAKVKLMKACKHVKQELQVVKDSGLGQMLVDIEARCDALEKEKAQITEELLAERSLRAEQESQQKATAKQLEDLILESTKWEGTQSNLSYPWFTSLRLQSPRKILLLEKRKAATVTGSNM